MPQSDYWTHNPIRVKGGLRLEEYSLNNWWAERYLSALDSFTVGHRQERGKRYATQGQVRELELEKGGIKALVQGTKKEPYYIEIGVETLAHEQWQQVFAHLKTELSDVAKLLAGSMPHNLEHVFSSAGVSLLPRRKEELWSKCSCPDTSNPCKHIAAVHYIVAQEFSKDPFLLLKLRGLSKEELLNELGLGTPAGGEIVLQDDEERLSALDFWSGGHEELPPLPALEGELTAHMALIKQLGAFPLWRGHSGLLRELKGTYAAAQTSAVNLLANQTQQVTISPLKPD